MGQPVNFSNNNNDHRTQRRSSSQQGVLPVDHCSTSELQRGPALDSTTPVRLLLLRL